MTLSFRPHVPRTDPRSSAPDDVLLDGVTIGTVTRWSVGSGPMFTATICLNPEASLTYLAKTVCGAGETPDLAVLKALSDGIADHATCLARARALEARIMGMVPA